MNYSHIHFSLQMHKWNTKYIFLKKSVKTINDICNVSACIVIITLGRYICWGTISSRGYHPPNSKCLPALTWFYLSGLWLFCLGPLMFLLWKAFKLFVFQTNLAFSVPDESYSRHTPCALNFISTYLLSQAIHHNLRQFRPWM